VLAGIVILVTISDNILPAWMTKKFGGSRSAVIGSIIGTIAGLFFFPPLGLLIGPFLGALIGEILYNQNQINQLKKIKSNTDENEYEFVDESDFSNTKALKVALGAFLAFIIGTGLKLVISFIMIFYAVRAVFF